MSEKRKCLWCRKVYYYYYDEDNGWEDHYCSEECEEKEIEYWEEMVEYERRDFDCKF